MLDQAEPLGRYERELLELAACERARMQPSEPNFTKAIATLLSHDGVAAAQFARAIVTTLRPAEVHAVPTLLSCHPEVFFYGRHLGPDRRADFVFTSSQRDYVLLVEAKLGAKPGHRQVRDYILAKEWWLRDERSVQTRRSTLRVALVGRKAIDSSDVSVLAGKLRHRDRWLGALTWLEVRNVLAGIEFENSASALLWRTLFDAYDGPKGMGTAAADTFSPEQLLDGVALALGRRNSLRVPIFAVPWGERSDTIVRNGRMGLSAMMRVEVPRRSELTVLLGVTDDGLVLELSGARRSARSIVPNDCRRDLRQFESWLHGEITQFDRQT